MRELVAAATLREAKLICNASAASEQIARSPAALHQACDTITTQSKKLASVAQLKSSTKSPENRVAFHEASEDELKGACGGDKPHYSVLSAS